MIRAKWMLAFMLTLLPTLAAAQLGGNERIKMQVPFEFVVANRTVPAGMYLVKAAVPEGSTLMLRNSAAKVSVMTSNVVSESETTADSYAMVFKKYGETRFLSEIRIAGSRMVCRLPENKAETELRAKNAPSTEEILLASGRK